MEKKKGKKRLKRREIEVKGNRYFKDKEEMEKCKMKGSSEREGTGGGKKVKISNKEMKTRRKIERGRPSVKKEKR